MIRKHIYIRKDQLDFLDSIPGTLAEQVRNAIDDYIEGQKPFLTASSKSKRKEEE